MSLADRKLAARSADEFLLHCPAPPRKPNTHYRYDAAAYQAIGLRLQRIKRNKQLRGAIRRKWLPAIFNESLSAGEEWQARLKFAYSIDASACLRWFRESLTAEDRQKSGINAPSSFRTFWDSRLAEVLRSFLLRARQPTSLVRGISFLVQRDRGVAANVWFDLYSKVRRRPFNRRHRVLVLLGLFCFPEQWWEVLSGKLRKQSRATQIRFCVEGVHALTNVIDGWSERLTDSQVADWYLLLADLFPPHRIRGYARGGTVRARDEISDLHRACSGILTNRGTASSCKELLRVSEQVPPDERIWHRWHYNNCVQQRLRTEWARDIPSPEMILQMSRISSAVRVRDNGELQDAIVQSLHRLQEQLRRGPHPRILNLWNGTPGKPHQESRVQALVAQWLENDIKRADAMVIDREVQIGHTGHSDIKVEIPANTTNGRPRLIVIVEIKRSMHAHVDTACETQLAEGYLRRKHLTHGIYLVAWFGVEDSRLRWKTAEEAWKQTAQWAAASTKQTVVIKPFVLDCRWIEMDAPST
jgi:hypothetical protein